MSYRKKDRRYANELMHTIHSIPSLRSVSIWFDEFMSSGEKWSDQIGNALKQSDVFLLMVSPSITEPDNYVIWEKYPAARKQDKKIVSVGKSENKSENPDIEELRQIFPGLRVLVDGDELENVLREISAEAESTWKKCFDRLWETGSIFGYRFKLVDSDQEAVDYWAEEFGKTNIDLFDGTINLFQSMYANSALLQVIQERYPYFEFDGRNKAFKRNRDCRFLSYIEDHTYLGIEEMFGLLGAEDMEYNYPVLGNEYLNLWNIYIGRNRGNKSRWKDNVRYSAKCWTVMCDTLENFSELYPNKEVINLDELQQSYRGYQRWNHILNIIRELAGKNGGKQYLIPEEENDKMVAFRYSNPDIKSVLTKAGDILEIYTYFRVCEMGYFDDVTCGYRFRWEEERVNNELDQNFYFKLNLLVDMFGAGAHKVLLTTANTKDNDDNRMQRERGNMMGITTISEIEEIQDIAETLMALLQ